MAFNWKGIVLYGLGIALLALVGNILRLYLLVKHYQPEWFTLALGGIFLVLGMFMGNVMNKNPVQDVPEIQPMGSNTLDGFAEKHGLSVTEKAILELLINGLSNAEIADKRHVSENTVKTHLSNIYSKTGVGSRAKLISLLRP